LAGCTELSIPYTSSCGITGASNWLTCDDGDDVYYYQEQQQPTGEAPRFKRGLTTLNVELSKPIKLDCEVEGKDACVSWYRNGIELEGPRYM